MSNYGFRGLGIRCPICGSMESKVYDSRGRKETNVFKRRRKCKDCGYRYTTEERIVNGEIDYQI